MRGLRPILLTEDRPGFDEPEGAGQEATFLLLSLAVAIVESAGRQLVLNSIQRMA